MSATPCKGWVYILTNPAMPGVVKVGCTGRKPEDRARELSNATGVPARFVVAWACPVSHWQAVEGLAHSKLHACRSNRNREFFACSVDHARREIERASRAYLRPAWLRLIVGPSLRRSPSSPPTWVRSRCGGDPALSRIILALLLVVVLVGTLRPAMPSWAPMGLVRSMLWIELHAPRRIQATIPADRS